jgi:uncharacterized protein (UPF0261 family)
MSNEKPAILIIGCFDTKGEVFAHLRNEILKKGERILMVNAGVLGSTTLFPVDVEADLLAEKGGMSLQDLRKENDRALALSVMADGAAVLLHELYRKGSIKAAIGMGGGGGTYLALTAMQNLPLGFPKLCVSTLATRDVSGLVGMKDIVLMPSVVDVAGMNSIIQPIIDHAAAAITAMADTDSISKSPKKGSIAISMFGNTTACVNRCTELLQNKGYEVMAFHANGVGGKAMEALVLEGCFDAVLDLTTTELADELCGGILTAGPKRLEAAVAMRLPLVVAPGCLDMVNFGTPDSVPQGYKSRHLYSWAPDVTLMRTNEEENRQLGQIIADKLNQAVAPVKLLWPHKGFSQLDAPGGRFYRPDVNEALLVSLKNHLRKDIPVEQLDVNINEPPFADAAVTALLYLLEKIGQE